MRLVVVGCAGSFPSAESACSAYLVQADDERGRTWTVALDLGNGALGALQRYGDVAALDAVALTHLHADHVADMAVLSVARRYRPSGALPVSSRMMSTASFMWARSVASSTFWYEIQRRPWQAISWPSSWNAATASGLRFRAIDTPNTVNGSRRCSNMRSRRHSPAREPYS